MKVGVLLLNFGEPEQATLEEVVPFLERIFVQNAALMGPASPERVRERSRKLAEERAPGLIEEYQEIGGSPLHRQAAQQAEALQAELTRRGFDTETLLGMQFTEPSIQSAVSEARARGVELLVGLPVYPLPGPSTSVAALADVESEVARLDWDVPVLKLTGWQRHPAYNRLRVDAIRRVLDENALSLRDPGTKLVFSAHGTPVKYLEEGSRYDIYVREFCAQVAAILEAPEYVIGYQNHSNRPGVPWTQPDIDRVIAEIDAERVVVDPVSFMHEQSETLAELDHELREEAEARGLGFFRVPIPHDAPEFIAILADAVATLVQAERAVGEIVSADRDLRLRPCICRATPGTFCTNGDPAV
jgi:protoporphyrin/coproporphyrin ferrochelatase